MKPICFSDMKTKWCTVLIKPIQHTNTNRTVRRVQKKTTIIIGLNRMVGQPSSQCGSQPANRLGSTIGKPRIATVCLFDYYFHWFHSNSTTCLQYSNDNHWFDLGLAGLALFWAVLPLGSVSVVSDHTKVPWEKT